MDAATDELSIILMTQEAILHGTDLSLFRCMGELFVLQRFFQPRMIAIG